MSEREIQIINKLGLHARAAAKFVQTASRYVSEINIHYNGKDVSGKSIMGVMMLAAGKDAEIKITAEGEDERQALDAIETLINDRFGEEE